LHVVQLGRRRCSVVAAETNESRAGRNGEYTISSNMVNSALIGSDVNASSAISADRQWYANGLSECLGTIRWQGRSRIRQYGRRLSETNQT